MPRLKTKWTTDMQGFRDDFAHWLAMPEQGKSLETAKLYAVRAARWLQGDMESLEFIEDAGNLSEKKIRRSALAMLAKYEAYSYNREIVLPACPVDREGEHAPLLAEFRTWMRAAGLSKVCVTKYSAYTRNALIWLAANPDDEGYPYKGFIAAATTTSVRNDTLKSLMRFRAFMRAEHPNDARRPIFLPKQRGVPRKPPVYLSPDEAYKVGQYLRYRCSLMAYAAWALAYGVGMRACEIAKLEVDDIAWGENGIVRIINSKNGSSRDVPIPTQTQAAVKAYIELDRPDRARFSSSRRVFLSRLGGLWHPKEIRTQVCEAIERLGARKIHQPLHMWRWMYATHLAEQMRQANGAVDWQMLARLLGHRNIVTTQLYVGEVSHDQMLFISRQMNPMERPPIEDWKDQAQLRRARQASLEVAGGPVVRPVQSVSSRRNIIA